MMKKNKIFIACDSTNILRIKKIIKETKNKKLKVGYKFGLEFLNSKYGRSFSATHRSQTRIAAGACIGRSEGRLLSDIDRQLAVGPDRGYRSSGRDCRKPQRRLRPPDAEAARARCATHPDQDTLPAGDPTMEGAGTGHEPEHSKADRDRRDGGVRHRLRVAGHAARRDVRFERLHARPDDFLRHRA